MCNITTKVPVNFPRNQIEFEEVFSTEKKCAAFIVRLKWPDGFKCLKCGGHEYWLKTRDRLGCAACRAETSVTANTLFSNAKKPLRLWLHALWWMTSQKNGISAIGFQNIMGIGSYRTAWAWLHKLRRAMSLRNLDQLTGTVEVDETFIGGVRSGKVGRGADGKVLVAVAAEVNGSATGRIRLTIITDAKSVTLNNFIRTNIAPGSTVITDGFLGYRGVSGIGYRHMISPDAKNAVPRAHKAMSLLKRWLLGTHQGRIEAKYLQRYLDEFVFRFNRRLSGNRGKLFKTLLELCLSATGETTAIIIAEANKPQKSTAFLHASHIEDSTSKQGVLCA